MPTIFDTFYLAASQYHKHLYAVMGGGQWVATKRWGFQYKKIFKQPNDLN